MPKAIILIGAPGSGKSTWRDRFLANSSDEYVIVSSDDIIEERCKESGISYTDGFTKYIGYASAEMKNRLKTAIAENKNIIWDQTNMTVKSRRSKIKQLVNYEVHAKVFNIPDDVLKSRLKLREEVTGKNIPDHILKNMQNSYVPPSKEEGFKTIEYV